MHLKFIKIKISDLFKTAFTSDVTFYKNDRTGKIFTSLSDVTPIAMEYCDILCDKVTKWLNVKVLSMFFFNIRS